ncbi:unnamed protein product [Lactuca saligna]|uniref:Uncharacterized protein n=1 Tax=Lactuca saligna TaxID=75948 RepID=A0AA35ZRB9_LACSI|nr:unnamed protein product [Lactuca saligna]
MSRSMMLVVHSTVSHEQLDQVTVKYQLVNEDDSILPVANVVIDRPSPGKSSKSSIGVRKSYDGINDDHTPLVATRNVINIDGDREDGSGEQPLIGHKRDMDSATSTSPSAVLSGG